MKAGRPAVDAAALREVVELLAGLELVSVTAHGEHALTMAPILLSAPSQCDPDNCLTVHCRVAGRYMGLHLTRADAVRLAHLLYYRASTDPLAA